MDNSKVSSDGDAMRVAASGTLESQDANNDQAEVAAGPSRTASPAKAVVGNNTEHDDSDQVDKDRHEEEDAPLRASAAQDAKARASVKDHEQLANGETLLEHEQVKEELRSFQAGPPSFPAAVANVVEEDEEMFKTQYQDLLNKLQDDRSPSTVLAPEALPDREDISDQVLLDLDVAVATTIQEREQRSEEKFAASSPPQQQQQQRIQDLVGLPEPLPSRLPPPVVTPGAVFVAGGGFSTSHPTRRAQTTGSSVASGHSTTSPTLRLVDRQSDQESQGVTDLESQTEAFASFSPDQSTHAGAGFVEAWPVMQEMPLEEAERVEMRDQLAEGRKQQGYGGILVALTVLVFAIVLVVTLIITSKRNDNQIQSLVPVLTNAPITAVPSQVPSSAPTSSIDLLLDSLPGDTLAVLTNTSTPQWQAVQWLRQHRDITSLPEWRKEQLFALATFYYAFDGPNWRPEIRDDWLDDTRHECLWFSSEFGSFKNGKYVPNTDTVVETCNDQGKFQTLTLTSLELLESTPQIPAEIALLTSLEFIDLSLNDIHASLDEFLPVRVLGKLNQLKIFLLNGNALEGTLVTELGLFSEIEKLGLSENWLSGTLVTELAQLGHLQELYLHENQLSGSVTTELSVLTNMKYMYLRTNLLTSSIPTDLGMLSSIREISLRENQLTSTLPTELALLTIMREFSARDNALVGQVPSEFGVLTGLEELYLRNNMLSGTLPGSFFGTTKLKELDMQNNLLNGTLYELSKLVNLKELYLRDNQFSGRIESSIGLLSNLTKLNLRSNTFTGVFPTEIGLLTNLRELNLRDNDLTGLLVTELGQLLLLEELDLSINGIEGSIPAMTFGRLRNLEELYLRENRLNHSIPSELGLLSNITELDLSSNLLSSSVPTELGLLTNMQELSLRKNILSNTLPSELGSLVNLVEFSIRTNFLSGTIPSSLGQLRNAKEVYLNENLFTGSVPTTIGLMSSMEELILAENLLSDIIPFELGQLSKTTQLDISDNLAVRGPIPTELGLLTSLTRLDLFGTSLSSSIPIELAKLAESFDLRSFNITSNAGLIGTVPPSLCFLEDPNCFHGDGKNEECYIDFDCTGLLCGCSCGCA